MAKVNVPQQPARNSDNGITKNADHSVQLSAARSSLCIDATWEIDALARMLPDIIPLTDETTTAMYFSVRGITARILQLNEVVMGALSDEIDTVERMHRVVNLKLPEVAHV